MTGDEVLGLLRGAIATVLELDPTTVGPGTRFVEDLAADSLAIVEIVEVLEEELARRTGRPVRLEDEDLDALCTVSDAVAQVLALLPAGSP